MLKKTDFHAASSFFSVHTCDDHTIEECGRHICSNAYMYFWTLWNKNGKENNNC